MSRLTIKTKIDYRRILAKSTYMPYDRSMFNEIELLSRLNFAGLEIEFYPRKEIIAKMVFFVSPKSIYTKDANIAGLPEWTWNLRDNTWTGDSDVYSRKYVSTRSEEILSRNTKPYHEALWQGLLVWKQNLDPVIIKTIKPSADFPAHLICRYTTDKNDMLHDKSKIEKRLLGAWWHFRIYNGAAVDGVQTVNIANKTLNSARWTGSKNIDEQIKKPYSAASRKVLANMVRTLPTLSNKLPHIEWGWPVSELVNDNQQMSKLLEIYRINWEEDDPA